MFWSLTRLDGQGRARVLDRGRTPMGFQAAFVRMVRAAGLPEGYASPHGLKSGLITEAARAGPAVEAMMRVTLHRSRYQVAAYYHELELAKNPPTRLRDRTLELRLAHRPNCPRQQQALRATLSSQVQAPRNQLILRSVATATLSR